MTPNYWLNPVHGVRFGGDIASRAGIDIFTFIGIACQLNTGETEKNAPMRVRIRMKPNIFPANRSIGNTFTQAD